jgi:hypothetical protein
MVPLHVALQLTVDRLRVFQARQSAAKPHARLVSAEPDTSGKIRPL